MKRFVLAAAAALLLAGCAPKSAPGPSPAPSASAEPQAPELYRQLAYYVRQGLIDYEKPGQYTLTFRRDGLTDYYEMHIAGEGMNSGGNHYTVTYDAQADWYTIQSGYEGFLGDPDAADTPPEEPDCVIDIDTAAAPAEALKFNSPPTPSQSDTRRAVSNRDAPDCHRWTYHYLDRRLGTEVTADYPQYRDWEETYAPLNDLLRHTAVEEPFSSDFDPRTASFTTLDVVYDVTYVGSQYLSVAFCADITAWGCRTVRDRWGLTARMETGEVLLLDDVVEIGDDFGAWVLAQSWTALDHWQPDNSSDAEYAAHCAEDLSQRDMEPSDLDFYLTQDALVIIYWDLQYDTRLSVPLSDLKLKIDL